MRSSRAFVAIAIALSLSFSSAARAQARGFALERFYPSAPGGGWFVLDDLGMHGGFGGAISVSGGYAHDPLLVENGSSSALRVVGDEAFMSVGLAASYERFRVYLDLTSPVAVKGTSGDAGPYHFDGPAIDLGTNPDLITAQPAPSSSSAWPRACASPSTRRSATTSSSAPRSTARPR
jgi:hypothetical protein